MPYVIKSTICVLLFFIAYLNCDAVIRKVYNGGFLSIPSTYSNYRFLENSTVSLDRFKHDGFEFISDNENREYNSKFKLHVRGKPSIRLPPVDRSKLPKDIELDYENILRSNDPSIINYNTRLTGFPGIDIRKVDNLYGRIYDSRVLIRQLRYFLERDDFHSVPRLLRDNKYILNRQVCAAFSNDIFHLLHVRLKYRLPEKETLDEDTRFLVSRYVSQHILQQDLESRLYYRWLEPGEIPPKVPSFDPEYREPNATPEKPIHVKDTIAYRKLIQRVEDLDENVRLKTLRELYYRLLHSKKNKLLGSLWRYQKLKECHRLGYFRKVRNKVDIDRISPFLSRPLRCTDEISKLYTGHFEEAIDKKDLATACWILKRYTRYIDCKNRVDLFKKFVKLFEEVHECKKYNQDALKLLRGLYRTTITRRKVLIKWNEPLLVRDADKSMKELYEEQLEAYRKRRDARNIELCERRGINVKEVEDFSNVYGEDWIPILYPEEYKEQLEKQKHRLDKLRAKVQWIRSVEQEKKRKEQSYEPDEVITC
ncbi:hypothetical protein BdWA1_000177 [Babesia duncani]|uniref:Uncharacterized protein n=1 Tax=Babesia duncani TaxID=323732 RepID=A0AAD9PLW0_9APIC|nr:hypothetical protein BdWA1_000177 [Babesia duncani]